MGFQAAISTMPGTQCWVSVVLGWTPHPRHMAGYVDLAVQTHGRVLTLFTTVVTDSVDTGMLLTYIYTS